MKLISVILNALLAGTVSAGWIYPSKSWRSVSQTLPGATFRKRSVPAPPARLLERGGGGRDLYQACSTANLASKYNKYPINGLAVGGATIAVINDNSGFGNDIIDTSYSSASSAYDCCVQAQGMPASAVFYYSSSQDPGFRCLIVTTSYCQYPSTSTVIFGATYNGSEPRGTVYGNYLGNGRCGPGFTVAQDSGPSGTSRCASAFSMSSANFSSAGAGASSCYTPPGTQDLGGATPAG